MKRILACVLVFFFFFMAWQAWDYYRNSYPGTIITIEDSPQPEPLPTPTPEPGISGNPH